MRISDWSSDVCSSDLWGPWRSTRWQATRESNPLRIMFGHQGILFFIDSFGFLDLASRDSYALVWICGEECVIFVFLGRTCRSEEHTSELQSLMRISYAVLCLKNKKTIRYIQ